MKDMTKFKIYPEIMAMILTTALAVPAVAQQRGPRYVITDLGTLGGGFSNSFGLNERDQVGGGSTLPDGTSRAFLWSPGTGMQPLGTLHGGSNSSASGPNANDLVAIISDSNVEDPYHENFCGFGPSFVCVAGFWQNGTLTELKGLVPISNQGGSNMQNTQTNNRGQIAGYVENGVLDPTCQSATPGLHFDFEAVLWNGDSQPRQLNPLPGDTVGFALSINEAGRVVGGSGVCADTPLFPVALSPHAVFWDKDGVAVPIPGLGGTKENTATSINDLDEVVGASSLPGDTTIHAYLWNRHMDRPLDLGTVPGDLSSSPAATGPLNNRSEVVGDSCASTDPFGDLFSGACRAFLWKDNNMMDLNSLVVAGGNPSNLYMFLAFGINNRSAITGWAFTPQGEVHAFLATPCEGAERGQPGCTISDSERTLPF
jgi:probable HAF family extracellular repeat protein